MLSLLNPTQKMSLKAAHDRGETGVRMTISYGHDCGGRMTVDGIVATGLPIVYPPEIDFTYHPDEGEVLKSHYMHCDRCRFEQWS